MRGPIDYIVVGFIGNEFKGEILRALDEQVQNNTIAVLDLAVIAKDAEGGVASIEVTAPDNPAAKNLAKSRTGHNRLIEADDVTEIGELLEPSTAAGLLIIEHLWAKDLKKAIINTRGTLLAEGRIHPEAYDELNEKIGA